MSSSAHTKAPPPPAVLPPSTKTTASSSPPPNLRLPPLLHALQMSLGKDVVRKIQTCAVLVVGAGGIGCELLKNLALSGFQNVQVIDLDAIDVSNLNRQLLFRSQHVGQPKCKVACQVVLERLIPTTTTTTSTMKEEEDEEEEKAGFNDHSSTSPTTAASQYQYIAHHGNVCDATTFHVPFVSQFDLVLNALDNVTARRRVNRLCLAAKDGVGVPMIEAGTTGYLGQVAVVQKHEVQCYECRPQETPKVYPICTIRSTPSMPVHTIVWAKECYKLLFHPKLQESLLYEAENVDNNNHNHDGDGNNRAGGGATAVAAGKDDDDDNNDNDVPTTGTGEPSAFMGAIRAFRAAREQPTSVHNDGNTNIETLARNVVKALYTDEIVKQLKMDRYKAANKAPVALNVAVIQKASRSTAPTVTANPSSSWSTTAIWSDFECASELVACLVDAAAKEEEEGGEGTVGSSVAPEFDKDDELAMRFVTAASNLRNHVFGIEPLQSYYSAKGIAGNIIPAIATTNAIVAGLQILQAFHILRAQLERENMNGDRDNGMTNGFAGASLPPPPRRLTDACRYINCVRQPSRNGLYLIASQLEPPNPECFVCRNATVHVRLNVHRYTLSDLLDRILKRELGFVEPALLLEGNVVWEEGEDGYETNLVKRLPDLPCGGIQHGTTILVEDYSQDLSAELVVSHCDMWPPSRSGQRGGDNEDNRNGDTDDDPLRFEVGGTAPAAVVSAAAAAANTTGVPGLDDPADSVLDDEDDIVEISDESKSTKKRASNSDYLNSKWPALKRAKREGSVVNGEIIEIDDE